MKGETFCAVSEVLPNPDTVACAPTNVLSACEYFGSRTSDAGMLLGIIGTLISAMS